MTKVKTPLGPLNEHLEVFFFCGQKEIRTEYGDFMDVR